MVKRNILIGSLIGPNFAIRTAKLDRSRTYFIDLCSLKDIQKETFCCWVETFSLLSDQDQKFCRTSMKMA